MKELFRELGSDSLYYKTKDRRWVVSNMNWDYDQRVYYVSNITTFKNGSTITLSSKK